MRFHRGVSYQPTPLSLEVTEREIQAKPQATAWTCRTLAEIGMSCSTPQPQKLATNASASEVHPKAMQVRSVICPSSLLREVGEVHQVNIRRSLSRRIQVAKERGDKALLRALESELRETMALQ